MKKLFIPIALLLLSACGNRSKNADTNFVGVEPFSYADSVFIENDYAEGYSTYQLEVDFPVTDNKALHDSIVNWMFHSNDATPIAFAKADKERFFAEEGNEPLAMLETNYILVEQTDHYVTYLSEGSIYTGGAHPLPWYMGMTFSKKDGSRMGYNMFDQPKQLEEMVAERIRTDYFGIFETEEEEYLFEPEEPVQLPEAQPWIENDSIIFCYGPYEIAPYAAGMPFCSFSKTELKPYLNKKGKALFDFD